LRGVPLTEEDAGLHSLALGMYQTRATCAFKKIEGAQKEMMNVLRDMFRCTNSVEFDLLMKTIMTGTSDELKLSPEKHIALKEVVRSFAKTELPGWQANAAEEKMEVNKSWATVSSFLEDADKAKADKLISTKISEEFGANKSSEKVEGSKMDPLVAAARGAVQVPEWTNIRKEQCEALDFRSVFEPTDFRKSVDVIWGPASLRGGLNATESERVALGRIDSTRVAKNKRLSQLRKSLLEKNSLDSESAASLRCVAGTDMISELGTQVMLLGAVERLFYEMEKIANSKYFRAKFTLRGNHIIAHDFGIKFNEEKCPATVVDTLRWLKRSYSGVRGDLQEVWDELKKQQCLALEAGMCNTNVGMYSPLFYGSNKNTGYAGWGPGDIGHSYEYYFYNYFLPYMQSFGYN